MEIVIRIKQNPIDTILIDQRFINRNYSRNKMDMLDIC